MTQIYPFIGTRYNSRLIEDMNTTISPSYDSLSPQERDEICRQHPCNILHLIPACVKEADGEYNNPYLRAASTIQTWRRDGILVNDNHRSFYFYQQKYSHPINGHKIRHGLYALINLNRQQPPELLVEGTTPFSSKSCHLKLLRATRCNYAPVFMFFHDPGGEFANISREITPTRAWEELHEASGDIHRLWVLNKKDQIARMTQTFQDKECFIVEGHQRYEVALKYRNEEREATRQPNGSQPFDYILVFLSSFEEESVTTRPVHRVLSAELGSGIDMQEILEDLAQYFNVRQVKVNLKKPKTAAHSLLKSIAEKGKKNTTFAMALPDGRSFLLSLKPKISLSQLYDEDTHFSRAVKKLDVSILYHCIIRQAWIGNPEVELEEEDILYFDDAVAALQHTISRKGAATFLLNPCPTKQIAEVVASGDIIPPFSVKIHPPLINGLVIRDMTVRH